MVRYLFDFKTICEEAIDEVNNLLEQNPTIIIVITIPNLKDSRVELLNKISDNKRVLIKVEGGYDKERLRNDIGNKYIHNYSNLYTIEQVFLISDEINNIIKRIHKNWTKEQILVYFLNELRTKVIYDTQYRRADPYDIRNLTGLYTTKTVCGGYAMILKELCDQVDIDCMFVEGFYGTRKSKFEQINHAWNIVKLYGKYYPIDVTNDINEVDRLNRIRINGSFKKDSFLKKYTPGSNERIVDYKILSGINSSKIDTILKKVSISQEYMGTIYILKRDDKTEFIITECDYQIIDNNRVIKYIVSPLDSFNPQIVYSTFDLKNVLDMYEEKEELRKEKLKSFLSKDYDKVNKIRNELLKYDKSINFYNLRTITNMLFSEDNINTSCQSRKGFLGTGVIDKRGKIFAFVSNKEIIDGLNGKMRVYTRSDGTRFVVDWIYNYDSKLYSYKVYEYINYKMGYKLLENTIYTDFDILVDDNSFLPNVFLSRERIDERCLNNNGYLGHYINDYLLGYNKEISDSLEEESRISIVNKKKVLVKKV